MKKILGACIGDCVHIAGIHRFLQLAEKQDYETIFLGPATKVERIIEAIREHDPDIVGLSYRLTPETGTEILQHLKRRIKEEGLGKREFILGGLPELIQNERQNGFFNAYFQGDDSEQATAYLRGIIIEKRHLIPPQQIIERIDSKIPFPVLRHHFGLPSLEETVKGIKKIAESGCLDVISLGTDQNAQANFFHPERMSTSKGAGGVPVRAKKDFDQLYQASRIGNYPLMRTYAGTDDLVDLAQLYIDTINNAWTAIPIFWYNKMDGRGPMDIESSIKVHLDAIKWHAEKDIPVEILESHQWSMRDSDTEVAIAAGFLGANICKELGVKTFISQYMFNTPPQINQRDDLAKMLAQKEMIESLQDDNFQVYTQTRTGLFSYPIDLDMAKGQLAQSTMLQMQLNPHIVHVVSYSEANHAATPENIIESCKIAKQVITKCLEGQPRMIWDPYVIERKEELIEKSVNLFNTIKSMGSILNPNVLHECVDKGLLHAPQLDSYMPKEVTIG
ncbi:MAG: cobalamin-dependent protein [Candidatus Heimdallarchaeota archaeon]|nr:cobalamin-dependent protein [Candidatus Heimdallarchaeota archaeon]MCK4954047.1 cobalamin-dependent protein [Candidatus Heimdallarchaeota archaeon]